ncbi:MAG: lipopolysaccharide assembly protein LapA domain-containing protein [Sphingomicrobium sp.]
MHFLKTLFWVLVAVVVALFAKANWAPVTVKLWGDIVADVQLPLLLLLAFIIGWLPTWIIMRARTWSLNRRVEALELHRAQPVQAASAGETEPVT